MRLLYIFTLSFILNNSMHTSDTEKTLKYVVQHHNIPVSCKGTLTGQVVPVTIVLQLTRKPNSWIIQQVHKPRINHPSYHDIETKDFVSFIPYNFTIEFDNQGEKQVIPVSVMLQSRHNTQTGKTTTYQWGSTENHPFVTTWKPWGQDLPWYKQ